MRSRPTALAAILASSGCYVGTTLDTGEEGTDTAPADSGRGDGGEHDDDDGGSTGDEGPGDAEPTCATADVTALTRLTAVEYENTARSALGIDLALTDDLPADAHLHTGFVHNASATVDGTDLRQYQLVAERVAAAVDLTSVQACDDGQTCVEQTLLTVGRRLYRRPLTEDELQRWIEVYDTTTADGTAHGPALRLVIEGMLQSPSVLYQQAVGDPSLPAPQGLIALTSHEVAARLAYLLWDDLPDATLDAAADADLLRDADALEEQVRRMLDDPRARPAVERFFVQWLDADSVSFSGQADGLGTAMRDETLAFVRWLVWEPDSPGNVETLLTARHTFVDEELAAHYGLTYPSDAEGVQRVPLPPERPGVLGQGSFLARTPPKVATIYRGLHVAQRFLCRHSPPPPATINPEEYGELTPREAAEARIENAECAACHQHFEPISFALEGFDAQGRTRSAYPDGSAIDLTGWFIEGPEALEFEGLGALASTLAQHPAVEPCVATRASEFAFGDAVATEDRCLDDDIIETFVAAGGDFRELFVAIATSDAFRYRTPTEDESWSC